MAVSIPITKTKITTQWGTSVSADITDLRETLTELQETGGGITVETAIDAVAAALKSGNNIDITYDDEQGRITINVEPLTKADVGLDLVNNTSDASKPISTATQTALDTKADSVATTSALSTRQPLDADLTAIAALTATTGNVIQSVASAWASRTPTELKVTLSLDNVNNTSDANKPVSTATLTALNLKADKTYVNSRTATVPRMTFYGGVSTDQWGQFTVNTGFQPTAAICIGTQTDYPAMFTVVELNTTWVNFKARRIPDGGYLSSTMIGVSYVIYGPPA